jgi:acetate kinase
VLVVNPGSASRKYALFDGEKRCANIHFEFENNKVIGNVEYDNQKQPVICDDTDLSTVSRHILPLLNQYGIIGPDEKLSAIGTRVVAPGMRFDKDELVTDEYKKVLESEQEQAPLHIGVALSEMNHLGEYFPGIPIIAVSDSAFHATKLPHAWHYGIDPELAESLGIKRYGYHGISVGSIIYRLQKENRLMPKTIVCHLGSGSSITAVYDGQSADTTMGYSPLEGLMMASRSGNIDVSAALMIKRSLNLDDDGIEQYLDKQSGLLGVSGTSNDIRQLLVSEEQGDSRAKLALDLFVYRIQQAIGQMAASIGGVDCLVFTATIGERSAPIRERVMNNLHYLGLEIDTNKNENTFEPHEIANIATGSSKPVLVIPTNEVAEIARRAAIYFDNK